MNNQCEVIGVRFKEVGKVYYFDPDDAHFEVGSRVIVETSRGMECGEVTSENHMVDSENIVMPLNIIKFGVFFLV